MSTNKDLLKQAIAEAKTIREAAIANAKEALEETLTPHLKEMLAQKLQEMEDKEDEDEKVMDENIYEAEEEEVEAEGLRSAAKCVGRCVCWCFDRTASRAGMEGGGAG